MAWRKPRLNSLSLLLPAVVLLFMLGGMAISWFSAMAAQQNHISARNQVDIHREVSHLSSLAQRWIAADPRMLEEDLALQGTDPRLDVAAVIHADGRILHATHRALLGKAATDALPGLTSASLARATGSRTSVVEHDASGRYLIALMSYATPARAGELRSLKRGVAYLAYDLNADRGETKLDLLAERLPELTALLLASLLLTAFLHRIVAHPLSQLEAAAHDMAGGHFNRPLSISGPREIQGLNQAFLAMRTHLVETISQLDRDARRTQAILDNVVDAIITTDPQGRILSFNRGAEHMFDYRSEAVIGRNVKMLMPEPDRSQHDGYLDHYLQTGTPRGIGIGHELLGERKDGSTFPIDLVISEIRHENETVYIDRISDISARKQADEQIRTFQNLVNLSGQGIGMAGLDATILYLNPALRRLLGVDEHADISTFTFCDFYSESDASMMQNQIIPTVLAQGSWTGEMSLRTLAGASVPTIHNVFLLRDAAGKPNAFANVLTDISEQRKIAEVLAESEARFRSIIESSPLPYAMNDNNQNVTYLNAAFTQTFGYTRDDIRTLADWWPKAYPDPVYRQWVIAEWENSIDTSQRQGLPFDPMEIDIVCKDRTLRSVLVSAAPLGEGNDMMHLVTFYDITARKRAETELRRHQITLEERVAQRTSELQALNQELEAFSYSVSHDLRTPLRALDGFSLALLEDNNDQLDDTGRQYLKRIRASAQHMGHLIDDLLKLSRVSRAPLLPERVDLAAMARDILKRMEEREPGRNVHIDIADALTCEGDPGLLNIVLENLLGNAWKYTGKIADAHISFDAIRLGDEAVFRVRDNGVGFDMAHANKLFGAFQRLHHKRDFEGTGIGLATVARIIRRHGGSVWAEAEPGKGAAFCFTIGKEHSG